MLIEDGKISALFSMEILFLGNRVTFLGNQTQISGKSEFARKKNLAFGKFQFLEIRRSRRKNLLLFWHYKPLGVRPDYAESELTTVSVLSKHREVEKHGVE